MIVTLNGQVMDIELEAERTVGEVLAAIGNWLGEKRLSIAAVKLNGRDIAVDELDEVCNQELDKRTELELQALAWTDLLRSALDSANNYLALAASLGDSGQTSDDSPRQAWLKQPAAGFLLVHDPTLSHLIDKAILDGTIVTEAQTLISQRLEELNDPAGAFQRLSAGLLPMAERLEQLPLELQTGQDASAAVTLRDFADLAAKLLRLWPLLLDTDLAWNKLTDQGLDPNQLLVELNEILRDLVSAYEKADVVLVGDLTEYEIAPRIRSLAAVMATA